MIFFVVSATNPPKKTSIYKTHVFRRMKKNTLLVVVMLSAVMLFAACKATHNVSRQKVTGNMEQSQEVVTALPAEEQDVPKPGQQSGSESKPSTQEEKSVVEQNKNYQWVSYRGKASVLFDEKQYSCNYFVVNRMDSIIYINLNVFGVEIARLVATPKEVIFVNKLTYEYYKGDYTLVEKYLKEKADFYTLQAVLNGQEEKLSKYSNVKVSYHHCTSPMWTYPFFDKFSVSISEGKRKVEADVVNLKFDTPGPTSIKIPESFNPVKY